MHVIYDKKVGCDVMYRAMSSILTTRTWYACCLRQLVYNRNDVIIRGLTSKSKGVYDKIVMLCINIVKQ